MGVKMPGDEEDFLKSNVEYNLKKNLSFDVIQTAMQIYMAIGVTVFFSFSGVFFLSTINFELSQRQQVALLGAGTGLALSLTSWLYLAIRKRRTLRQRYAEILRQEVFEFLDSWNELDEISKLVIKNASAEPSKYLSNERIVQLLRIDAIDEVGAAFIREGLTYRNRLAHSADDISAELNKVSEFRSKVVSLSANLLKRAASQKN
jgi:hypothetical protein